MGWPTISVAAVMIALGAAVWGVVARRVRVGEPVITFTSRRPVPWGGRDVLMVVLFYLLAIGACHKVFSSMISSVAGNEERIRLGSADAQTTATRDLALNTATSMAANLMTTGFALLWIFSHFDATLSDLGWRRDTVWKDVWLGLSTFAAIAAPIYGLQGLLSLLDADKHPIIEGLRREATPLLYLLAGLSAVAVAPVAEEFFFRVLLQGWLESASVQPDTPQPEGPQPASHVPRRSAVLVSSVAFSLVHVGHGYDPIPLFFLGLALGYLYQRTHRLLPSVTVHFCLNASSFLMLCLPPSG